MDGPPAYAKNTRYARYPAIPYLSQFFNDNYVIILDDIERQAEVQILKKWEEHLDIFFERLVINGEIAIGRSKRSYQIY